LYWKLRRKTTATAKNYGENYGGIYGLPPLASVGVLIKFVVVGWLTDSILDSFFTTMTVPPVTRHVQTALKHQ